MSKPTKEQEMKVTEWYLKEFWPNYPSKYCRGGKGSRGMALQSMLKVNPDKETMKRIVGNLIAQVRAAAKNPDRKWWVIGTTYVNNRLWEDEIESQVEIIERQKLKTCSVEGCESEIHGQMFSRCAFHTTSTDKRLGEAWKKTKLDFNSPNFQRDCVEYCKSKGFPIG
jgi:hypothetical protein